MTRTAYRAAACGVACAALLAAVASALVLERTYRAPYEYEVRTARSIEQQFE